MQDVIEELIRWVGYSTLRAFTLGRYRGGAPSDRLSEGGVGFAVVVGLFGLAYALT